MNNSDEFDEQPKGQLDMVRYLDIVRRRHMQFLAPFFVAWLLVWGSAWVLPPVYKSSTLILVEQPVVPKNFVVPNVSDDIQSALQSITQQILSRTRLLLIIDKHKLYENQHRHLTADQKVGLMRKDIDIELVRDPQNEAITAFRIFYSGPTPQIAQQVTSELTNLFIEQNTTMRVQQSQNTTKFLEDQLATARANLADQDVKVREYQASHQGSLPTQEASNLQILSGFQSQLENEQDALSSAKQQLAYHQTLVDQFRASESVTQSGTGTPTAISAIDQQLQALKTKLAALRTRYTDRYPEIQQVEQQIADAQKARKQALADLKKNAQSANSGSAPEVENPIQSGPLLQLQSQVRADQVEISNREQAIASLKLRISQYQERLSEEPAVAQQLADLTRGYQQSQENYNDLLKKENDSQMATSMEQLQQGERFTMLDPPSLPVKPDFPNRLKMCGAGVGAGMGLGLLVLLAMEFLDDRLHGDKQIRDLLSMPVLSEVPAVLSPADERVAKRKAVMGWVTAALILCAVLAGSAFSYFHA